MLVTECMSSSGSMLFASIERKSSRRHVIKLLLDWTESKSCFHTVQRQRRNASSTTDLTSGLFASLACRCMSNNLIKSSKNLRGTAIRFPNIWISTRKLNGLLLLQSYGQNQAPEMSVGYDMHCLMHM